MEAPADQERITIHRGLAFLRLGLIPAFIFILTLSKRCAPGLLGLLIFLLLVLAVVPILLYLFRRAWLAQPAAATAFMVCDFLVITAVSVVASQNDVTPVFFPLYSFLVAVEAACWWGRAGALVVGSLGGTILAWLYLDSIIVGRSSGVAMVALCLAWPISLGFFAQWSLQQWRERKRMAGWMMEQEGVVQQVHDRLRGWQDTIHLLQKAASLHELLDSALHEAQKITGSPLGLVALRDTYNQALRTECWQGFALPDAERTILGPGDRLPVVHGEGWIEVQHALVAPLRLGASPAEHEAADVGRLVVARPVGPDYQAHDEEWLQILASFTAAQVENRFLRGQLGRIQQEADSILEAGWTLAALPDPAAAMEMACRNVLSTLKLKEVVIFLYGRADEPGCEVVVYSEDWPVQTANLPLQGRGLRLLRRFLDAGTSVIFNRRNEWPQLFDLMAWKDVQAVACFPLYVLGRCWGAFCLLAQTPDAFPPQTQQSLAIFSGEVAMALENSYLRQAISEAKS